MTRRRRWLAVALVSALVAVIVYVTEDRSGGMHLPWVAVFGGALGGGVTAFMNAFRRNRRPVADPPWPQGPPAR